MTYGGTRIAHAYAYEHFYGVYSTSESGLDEFLKTVNQLFREVSQKADSNSNWNGKTQQGVIVGWEGKTRTLSWKTDSRPIKSLSLARRAKCNPEDISFVRLNSPWFDASFERGTCAMASHLPIFDEVGHFLADVVQPGLDSDELRTLLAQMFQTNTL